MVREIFLRTIPIQKEQTNYLGAVKLFFGAVVVDVIFRGVIFFADTVGAAEVVVVGVFVAEVFVAVVDVFGVVVSVGETLIGVVGDLLFAGWF